MFLTQEVSCDLSTSDSESSLYFSSELLEQLYFCDYPINLWLPFTSYLRKGILFTELLYSVWHMAGTQ